MSANAAYANAARILVIEDDALLAAHIREYLGARGFVVELLSDGDSGLALALAQPFDLLLMDIMLPGRSGLEVLTRLRSERKVPVILMSALGAEQDRIAGFTQGADDYLPKPFAMAELEVRVLAVLRRVAYERNPQSLGGDTGLDPQLVFDEKRQDVRLAELWAGLTPTEYRLLELLLRHVEEVMSKAFLYQQVLHRPFLRHDRVLDMHISHIRRKLQLIGYESGRVETVWGKGYVFTRLALLP